MMYLTMTHMLATSMLAAMPTTVLRCLLVLQMASLGIQTVAGALVEVAGRQLLVDGQPLHLKGVNWNPVPRGRTHPQGIDFRGYVHQDGDLMKEAGINAVRTYETLTDRYVLDELHKRGIWVINTVYIYGAANVAVVADLVNSVKDHPAILMWAVGNEWNYNGLYVGLTAEDSMELVQRAVEIIKTHDTTHPVSTVYGELPSLEVLGNLTEVDIWGLNVYRGKDFGDLFDVWATLSDKPMYIGEYGADAYNANTSMEDQEAQAYTYHQIRHFCFSLRTDDGRRSCTSSSLELDASPPAARTFL
eukprot:TRINITY_DN9563_c0_g1_i2.p1 TRINITY_DN9563_c0_g1~~TRINITY_DN9563_c0_g1_i2.p1  ORF type:complete len:303 (-),score=19.26 TRINITY_DN9563_c0_g1_i2:1181-2089(-)